MRMIPSASLRARVRSLVKLGKSKKKRRYSPKRRKRPFRPMCFSRLKNPNLRILLVLKAKKSFNHLLSCWNLKIHATRKRKVSKYRTVSTQTTKLSLTAKASAKLNLRPNSTYKNCHTPKNNSLNCCSKPETPPKLRRLMLQANLLTMVSAKTR